MRQLKSTYPIIGDVRGQGLLLGLELVTDRVTKERATEEAERILYEALSRGLSFKLTMGNIITLCPPLTITRQQLDTAFDILEECFAVRFKK